MKRRLTLPPPPPPTSSIPAPKIAQPAPIPTMVAPPAPTRVAPPAPIPPQVIGVTNTPPAPPPIPESAPNPPNDIGVTHTHTSVKGKKVKPLYSQFVKPKPFH